MFFSSYAFSPFVVSLRLSDLATAFAFATVFAFAAHVTRVATALAFAAIHAFTIVFVRGSIA
jgi:hypothetical protein